LVAIPAVPDVSLEIVAGSLASLMVPEPRLEAFSEVSEEPSPTKPVAVTFPVAVKSPASSKVNLVVSPSRM